MEDSLTQSQKTMETVGKPLFFLPNIIGPLCFLGEFCVNGSIKIFSYSGMHGVF